MSRGRLVILASALLASACTPYAWGRAPTRWDREPFERDQAIRVVGCAALGFSLDRETGETTDSSFLLDVSIRNLCVRSAPIDLSRLVLTGHDESGAARPITLYDPRHEVEPSHIDAQAEGTERLRIDVQGSLNATHTVCIDVSRISAQAAKVSPVCLYAPSPEPNGIVEEEP